MSLLTDLESDLKKIISYLPFMGTVAAVADPADALAIKAGVAALQPVLAAVASESADTLSHADFVANVIAKVSASSTELAAAGLLDSITAEHVAALTPVIETAVALSGLAKSA